ncbi:hypothetical protein RB595_010768 [Gaeumannomyces hyphopodioides]
MGRILLPTQAIRLAEAREEAARRAAAGIMGDAKREGPSVLDLNFLRPGSLELSRRSLNEDPEWENDIDKTIEISLGIGRRPLILIVRKIQVSPADITWRSWIAPDGYTRVKTELEPYDVLDINEAAATINYYVRENCLCFEDVVAQAHHAIRLVYERVSELVFELRNNGEHPDADEADLVTYEILRRFCPLWFGMRNMMGSAWLAGDERLGMKPVYDQGYPLFGKISVPRQVVQTVGCLLHRTMQPLQTEFLEYLQRAITPGRGDPWGRRMFYTLFVVVFVLLHECEDITRDRERYARQNFMKEKFSLPEYVERLHKNARQLVEHWLDFCDSIAINFTNELKLEASMCYLDEDKREVVLACYRAIVLQRAPVRASHATWGRDLSFVSHMFGVPWDEKPLYHGK